MVKYYWNSPEKIVVKENWKILYFLIWKPVWKIEQKIKSELSFLYWFFFLIISAWSRSVTSAYFIMSLLIILSIFLIKFIIINTCLIRVTKKITYCYLMNMRKKVFFCLEKFGTFIMIHKVHGNGNRCEKCWTRDDYY